LRSIFSIFKKRYRHVISQNLNPAILVDKLRPRTQRIWQHFSVEDKRRFIRHLRTRWNVARHRVAPEIHRLLSDAIATERLEIIRGNLICCTETRDSLDVEIETNVEKRVLNIGAVFNCTGPAEKCPDPGTGLLGNLIERGMVVPDEIDMGIRTGPDFSVIDRTGSRSKSVFALGSLLKGSLWETTAVPELRSQAFRVAETIATELSSEDQRSEPITEVTEDFLEYSI
jgi:uncharacterized NAD(P)/FAD-binding protein YdhS